MGALHYKIYPLYIARLFVDIGTFNYLNFSGEKRWFPIYIWVIVGGKQKIIVDVACDAEEMKKLLRAVVEEGTAMKAKELKRTLYGKTGTTNDYSDAWFIGFDDRLVVGVWVGRDDHTPIGTKETGARAALPIWMEFMKKVPRQTP